MNTTRGRMGVACREPSLDSPGIEELPLTHVPSPKTQRANTGTGSFHILGPVTTYQTPLDTQFGLW